jgi:hypothetical protein
MCDRFNFITFIAAAIVTAGAYRTHPCQPCSCLLALVESIAKRMVLLNDKVRPTF